MPPVLLHAHLHKAHLLLVRQQCAQHQRVAEVEILDEFARHAGELDADIGAGAAALRGNDTCVCGQTRLVRPVNSRR